MKPDEPFEFHLPGWRPDPDAWVRVAGGGLPQPVEVRFRLSGQRLVIVALRIDNEQEISSAGLRSVRLGELADQLRHYLQETRDDLQMQEYELQDSLERLHVDERDVPRDGQLREAWLAGAAELAPEEDYAWQLDEVRALHWGLSEWLQKLGTDEGEHPDLRGRGRGAKPPTHSEYRTFARTYLEELSEKPRGAKQRTADRLGMDRTTAYRWVRECQKRGLVPREGTREA